MAGSNNGVSTPLTRSPVWGLLIVARDQEGLCQSLKQAFGDNEGVTVLLDRRQGERRRGVLPVTADRRGTDRRSFPDIEDDLSLRKYVLVRPHNRRPHD